MAARRPFWKRHRWKSIGFCLWPPSTCIWSLKLKFQSKLDLCSGNHVVYRQTDRRTDGQTDKVNPVYPPSNFVGRGYKYSMILFHSSVSWLCTCSQNHLRVHPRNMYTNHCLVPGKQPRRLWVNRSLVSFKNITMTTTTYNATKPYA